MVKIRALWLLLVCGMVFAVPRPENNPTDEFYVLGFSATDSPSLQWAKKIIWYFNVDISFSRLSDDTKFEVKAMDKKIGFELLLPWKEVYPYHPWISEAIGFNLWFVKAVGETKMNYHLVVNDMNVGAEQKSRLYTRLKFQKPVLGLGIQSCLILDRNHCSQGDTVRTKMACLSSAPGKEQIVVSVNSGEGERLNYETFDFECPKGLKTEERVLKTSDLAPGGYRIKWGSLIHDFKGETGLTVLPRFDFGSMNVRLAKIKGKVSDEDVFKNYPADKDNIILAGFSMGGYGVYRTFFENPGKFRALAVFSGNPNMANQRRIRGGPHPNFLEDKYLKPFRDIPVFVFHGKKDRNCPFELAAQLAEKLKAAGARV